MTNQWEYRGWDISFDAKPIPTRSFDWMATSPDYDASYEGPEDGWVCSGHHVSAATYEELLEEIEACIAEQDDPAA